MKPTRSLVQTFPLILSLLGCSTTAEPGADSATGGAPVTGGNSASGGASVNTGGTTTNGGATTTGGASSASGGASVNTGGTATNGGATANGGAPPASGGSATAGTSTGNGGFATGGTPNGTGGKGGTTGGANTATGGSSATGGQVSASGGNVASGGNAGAKATGGTAGTAGAASGGLLIPDAGKRTFTPPVLIDGKHDPKNYGPAPVKPTVTPATSDPTNGVLTFERETAPADLGFHSFSRAGRVTVTGGSAATANHVYTVFTKEQLLSAINEAKLEPKIIRIVGHIDFRVDNGVFKEYTSYDDQKSGGTLFIPSNTTLVGINSNGKPAQLTGTQVLIGHEPASFEADFKAWTAANKDPELFPGWTRNVIVRNLAIETPWDVNPEDEANAYVDGVCVSWTQQLWLDHLSITDGATPSSLDAAWTRHDGALDIVRGSDYVTVSNSYFTLHDKTTLVGNADSGRAWSDTGRLHVTFTGNFWDHLGSRMPRVRYGQVHVYNNLVKGSTSTSDADLKFGSAIGMGTLGDVLAQNNFYDFTGLKPKEVCGKLVTDHGGSTSFRSSGARFISDKDDAGKAMTAAIDVTLTGCDSIPSGSTWTPPYTANVQSADTIRSSVESRAGAGKM